MKITTKKIAIFLSIAVMGLLAAVAFRPNLQMRVARVAEKYLGVELQNKTVSSQDECVEIKAEEEDNGALFIGCNGFF